MGCFGVYLLHGQSLLAWATPGPASPGRFYTHLPAGELLFPLRSVKECAAALEFTSASEEAATVRAHTRSATKGMDDLDWFHALVGKVQHLVPEVFGALCVFASCRKP